MNSGETAQAPAQEVSQVVEHLFRHEAGKMVATLTRVFGLEHLTLAERMAMAEGGDLKTKLFAAMAQTDCGACGWDCEGYAEAIATGETKDISLCVPGESETLDMLKQLMEAAGKEFEGA